MPLTPFFQSAKSQITILGTNPLLHHLEKSAGFFASLLSENPGLHLTLLYESPSENFAQALSLKTPFSKDQAPSFSLQPTPKNKPGDSTSSKIQTLAEEIKAEISDDPLKKQIEDRIFIRQFNLRLPVNIIRVDEKLWYCITTHSLPTIDSYREVSPKSDLYAELLSYLDFITDPKKGGIYLSKPGEELIEAYDIEGLPRGILPRKAFYTTAYLGYAVWAFVFNRKGELLLHQRSRHTKDNQLLWDKSVGGHVDLTDRDTSGTAKRELVEELFLPEAEFTDPVYAKRVKEKLGDIVNFGEWNPKKRPEKLFGGGFREMEPSNWVLFRALNEKGEPLTISRISNRRIRIGEEEPVIKQSRYLVDFFFVISPEGCLDTEEQVKERLGNSEKTGAAEDHRLVTIGGLGKWIEEAEEKGVLDETFTSDLLYIYSKHRELLESFSGFVKTVFEGN